MPRVNGFHLALEWNLYIPSTSAYDGNNFFEIVQAFSIRAPQMCDMISFFELSTGNFVISAISVSVYRMAMAPVPFYA